MPSLSTFNARLSRYACIIALLLSCSVNGAEQQQNPSDVDRLALAELLLTDQLYARAKTVLEKSTEEELSINPQRHFTLLGLAEKGLGHTEQARLNLKKAIKLGATEPQLYVHLAQLAYQAQDYSDVLAQIATLEANSQLMQQVPALWALKAQSYWLSQQTEQAWDTLTQAELLFPEDKRFLRRKVFYAIDTGLYQKASELGQNYLQLFKGNETDYQNIGNALRLNKQYLLALRILEQGRILFPNNSKIKRLLAHTYLAKGELNSAAEMMYQASIIDPELRSEAAELYMRAGRTVQAFHVNAQIDDETAKLKQRVGFYIKLQSFNKLANMEGDLYRQNLLKNDDILYAIAYANFKLAQFNKMEGFLSKIKQADLFRKAIELRKAALKCKKSPWQCLG
ncbi:MAG: tetratricopeptide repeat protein [bacterium]